MELAILRSGRTVGTLTAEDDGLYRLLRGRIELSKDILRLYLHGESFGVFVPEDGALCLRRRVSRARLPVLPDHAVAWCPSDGRWLPAGSGFCRDTPSGRELAVRWRTDGPMPFPAAPEKLYADRIEGVCCLVCRPSDQ